MQPKPLTRHNASGVLLSRSLEVDAQIVEALQLNEKTLLQRLAIRDHSSKEFFQEECLVYLIRENHALNNDKMVSGIFKALMDRCVGLIYRLTETLGKEREDVYHDILTKLVEKILNLDSDIGDFYQVRFWVGLKKLIITEKAKKMSSTNREKELARSIQLDLKIERKTCASFQFDNGASQEKLTICKDAINVLEDPYKSVFLLYHYVGMPIDSNKPNQDTLSKRFGKTSRTIRTWLRDAEEMIKSQKEGVKV